MPQRSVLSSWVDEVKAELKERKEKYDALLIRFERLEARMEAAEAGKTKLNRLFWRVVTAILTVAGLVIAYLSIKK